MGGSRPAPTPAVLPRHSRQPFQRRVRQPVLPSGCSYPSGSSVQITATAANGYQFTGWTGVDSSNGATAYVTVSNNRTVTANFTTLSTTTQTISTSRPGLSFSVDGTTYTTAQTFTWPSGTSHTLAAPDGHVKVWAVV